MLNKLRILAAILAVVAISFLCVLACFASSDSYNYCAGHNGEHETAAQNPEGAPVIHGAISNPTRMRVFVYCSGVFANDNGSGITAFGTILLFFATAGLFVFTALLWRATKTLIIDERENSIRELRAFVFLEDFDLPHTVDWMVGVAPSISNLSIWPRWKNSGKTPTRNLILRTGFTIVSGEIPSTFSYAYTIAQIETMCGPQANEWVRPIIISDDDATHSLRGSRNIYVWGRAEYRDVFKGTPQRFTEFCYRAYFYVSDNKVRMQMVPYGDYNRTEADTASA